MTSGPIYYDNLLVVDFEFTIDTRITGRPRSFFQEIIEVGAISLSTADFSIKKEYQAFVKPRFFPKLTEECRSFTLIRQEDLDGGITLEKMLNNLSPLFAPGKTALAAWGEADREVLGQNCKKYNIPYPFPWDDYVDLALAYKLMMGYEKTAGLKTAMEECGIEPVGFQHTALDDTRNTVQVLIWMMQHGWNPQPNGTAGAI